MEALDAISLNGAVDTARARILHWLRWFFQRHHLSYHLSLLLFCHSLPVPAARVSTCMLSLLDGRCHLLVVALHFLVEPSFSFVRSTLFWVGASENTSTTILLTNFLLVLLLR